MFDVTVVWLLTTMIKHGFRNYGTSFRNYARFRNHVRIRKFLNTYMSVRSHNRNIT